MAEGIGDESTAGEVSYGWETGHVTATGRKEAVGRDAGQYAGLVAEQETEGSSLQLVQPVINYKKTCLCAPRGL